MPLSSALRIFGVWSGPMALAGSRPVDVCLQTIYGLNSGVFLSTLLHLPYPNRGVVWRSVQSVFTRPFTPLVLLFRPSRICASVCSVLSCGLFFPRRDANRIQRRLESPCTCSYSLVQPGPVPEYRFYCLSARDTVCPIRCDVEILMAPGGKPSCLTTLPAVRHCQSQCEPTDSQTHLQSDGGLRCS